VSLAGYTLAGAVWGFLLPRVRPAFATATQAERHLRLGQGMALPTTLQLAHASAREEQVNRLLATVEGVLVAALTPLLGWWIDVRGGVDPVLVTVGLGFLAMLFSGILVAVLIQVQRRRVRSPSRAGTKVSRYVARPVSSRRVRAAW
jgi:hypothetical protein